MKVILTGATGMVGTECIRQALRHPRISQIVALARRPIVLPGNSIYQDDKAKFKSLVVRDFGSDYSDEVKHQLKGADTCIWNLALNLSKAWRLSNEEARKICLDYTMFGLEAMGAVANPHRPFRFVYTSSYLSELDRTKQLWLSPEYLKMRGDVENRVLDYVSAAKCGTEVQVTKPGLIDNPCRSATARKLMGWSGLPQIDVSEVAAAELDQAINGFEKPVLENEDLLRIGREALRRSHQVSSKWSVEQAAF